MLCKKKKRTAVLVKKIYLYNNLCKGLFFSFFESVMFFFLTSGSCRLEGKNILQSPFLVAHTPATKDSNSRSVLASPHMSLFPGTQKTYRIVCACEINRNVDSKFQSNIRVPLHPQITLRPRSFFSVFQEHYFFMYA